jgi:hypothetical protein
MRFKEQEINPYQDPINATELREGSVCYSVGIDGNIPLITTLYFIGKNLEADDSTGEAMFYFQDSTSHFAGVRYGDGGSTSELPATFLRQPINNLNGIYDLEAALQILMYYSLKQNKPEVPR